MPESSPARGKASITAIVALIASMLTVLARGTAAQPPLSPAPSASAAKSASGAGAGAPDAAPRAVRSCEERLLHPLFDLVGTEAPVSPIDLGAQRAAGALRAVLGEGATVDALVATIVDPIDSGMSYLFDTSLESLSLGVEEPADDLPAYYRDRSWLPWDDREASPEQRTKSQECRATTPGLIVFRTNQPVATPGADRPVALALFLVGETPTTGLHVDAMVSALTAARALTCAGRGSCGPLKLVAPTFSGSVSSLRVALKAWEQANPEDRSEIRIVTGSASGSDVPRLLTTPESTGRWLEHHAVTFSSTTTPTASAECAYFRFLERHLGVQTKPASSEDPRPVLPGVAVLHESGTEFGHVDRHAADDRQRPCQTAPAIDVTFPLHISALRDAYEEIDRKTQVANPALAHPTSLEISLKEKAPPLDTEGDPSPRTTYSADVALSSMLEAVGSEGVQHVAIVATDIADSIFLARKIRDIAPDVRLAFFSPDALLLHPSYQHDLLGSLVVSPYPFLGSNDFTWSDDVTHRHMAFDNATAEGIFNATLAARGATRPDQLLEYSFVRDPVFVGALPMWTSVIARTGLVPISVHATSDCEGTLFPRLVAGPRDQAPWSCPPSRLAEATRHGWLHDLDAEAIGDLKVHADATPPGFWHFIYVALVALAAVDWWLVQRVYRTFDHGEMPSTLACDNDKKADLALSRTKWLLYATIRRFILAVALAYMTAIYWMIIFAYRLQQITPAFALLTGIGAVVTLLAIVGFGGQACQFGKAFGALCKLGRPQPAAEPASAVQERSPLRLPPLPESGPLSASIPPVRSPGATSWYHGFLLEAGFAEPAARSEVAYTSLAQLRTLVLLSLLVAAGLGSLLVNGLRDSGFDWESKPRATLFVLRSVPLLNGVSPLAPTFCAMACVYAWSVSRMARLCDVHSLSRMSVKDGLLDLVCTPIRAVLYPNDREDKPAQGFTRTERATLDSILRPCTGPVYLLILLANLFLPVVLALLKPPSTLERRDETALLFAGTALCVVLIGATVAQLLQYWWALGNLLRRILAHPLRGAFSRISPFAKRSLDDRIARAPIDLLRFAGAAAQFDELLKSGRRPETVKLMEAAEAANAGRLELQDAAEPLSESVATARRKALDAAAGRDEGTRADCMANLGRTVLEAAQWTMRLLERAYAGELGSAEQKAPAAERPAPTSPSCSAAEAGAAGAAGEESGDGPAPPKKPDARDVDDAFAAVAWRFTAHELRWLRHAEEFVATVVTLLVERHVRQFQHFLYGLTACVLLLLAAFGSYCFEPHRLLLTCLWGVTGTVVLSCLYVFLELDRNTLLSLVGGTAPGHVTFDAALVMRLLTWVGIPLLGMAAAQYPEVANALGRVLEPFTHVLR